MKDKIQSHFFWKYANGEFSLFNKPVDVLYDKITNIVKFSYIFFLFLMFTQLSNKNYVLNESMIDPLWPMLLFENVSPTIMALFCQISLISGFILLTFFFNNRFLKVFVFVVFFLYLAFLNSFGKINHGFHLVLMLLFCFALIPNHKASNYKEKTILIFASAQFFALLAYALTGFWKVFWGIIEFFTKDVSLFSSLSFRNILIEQFQLTNPPVIGAWFLEHYYVGYVFYCAVVFVELFAIYAFFKSNLHKVWAVFLISMHLGIHLVLNVNMYPAIMAIGLLLLMSPFHQSTNLKTTLLTFPIVRQVKQRFF
ncbi:hypothetical protein ACFS5M_10610 [Lacinutrix iliipiscaria]|uniref:HTTM domain-containing protein n=1 Tax=Lacinutrix iliipiscaria TaxID=1230532 RepID=A0ABW5WSI2_9FLAO